MPWRYYSGIKTVDIVNKISPKSTDYWFLNCKDLTTINNIKNLNTNNVTSMYSMFQQCSSLISLDLSSFDTSNVTDMSLMFRVCRNLNTIYVGENWVISAGVNKSDMFTGCGTSTTTRK